MKKFKIVLLLIAFNFLLPTFLSAQMEWICATDSAGWSKRYGHTSVIFDNKMWVLGGLGDGWRNDVWYSSDGINWICATDSAGWSRRAFHTSVVFDNKMWVLGGSDYSNLFNDVWFSTDGINWICATTSAGWSARTAHTSVVFDGKVWVLGGLANRLKNDVWFSTDGANWTQMTDSAEWIARSGHTSIVFDNKMWILGGGAGGMPAIFKSDVWFSNDGANWTCATDSAGWSGRGGHATVNFNNKFWILGGMWWPGGSFNDVWFSLDGINWTIATSSPGWLARFSHTSVVFNNIIWLLGGNDHNGVMNNVWYSYGLGIGEERQTNLAEPLKPEIYPNPAKSFLAIRLPQTADRTELKIFDVSGKIVKAENEVTSSQNHKQELRISLKGINPGIYFLKFGKETKKFIVVK